MQLIWQPSLVLVKQLSLSNSLTTNKSADFTPQLLNESSWNLSKTDLIITLIWGLHSSFQFLLVWNVLGANPNPSIVLGETNDLWQSNGAQTRSMKPEFTDINRHRLTQMSSQQYGGAHSEQLLFNSSSVVTSYSLFLKHALKTICSCHFHFYSVDLG